jgi:hypothetical protein
MKDVIIEFLQAQSDPLSEPDIKGGVEGNNRHKQTALRELVAEAAIERHGRGTRGGPYRFSLAHFSSREKSASENLKCNGSGDKQSTHSHFSSCDVSANSQHSGSEKREHWEEGRL